MPTSSVRAVLSAAPVVAVILDRHNVVRFCNRATEKLNGIPADAMVGQKVGDLFPAAEPHRAPLIWAARRGTAPPPTLYESRTMAGRSCWLRTTVTPMARGDVLVWAQDVTAAVQGAALRLALDVLTCRVKSTPWRGDSPLAGMLLAHAGEADIEMGLAMGRGDLLDRLSRLSG